MTGPEGSRGEHDAPLPTGKRSLGERDAPLPTGGRSVGELDAPPTPDPTGKHLYLIFDDWEWGYSIRKLELPLRSPHRLRPLEQRLLRRLEPLRPQRKCLPPPSICLEAKRRMSSRFTAVGTNIIAAHRRNDLGSAPVPECIMPIVDVRSLGVRFGPGLLYSSNPIFITVGDKVFALGVDSFMMLSMDPIHPPHHWSWCDLLLPPLGSMDVTSSAVGSDGSTIFVSSNCATFAFDIDLSKWEQSSNSSLPFAGPANYVHALGIYVGLSKALDTYGHLCFCSKLDGDLKVGVSKENLLSKDPAESHVGATLVYLGGSEPRFCLVECVSIEGKSVNMQLEECGQLVKCVDEGGGNCGELDQLKKNVDEGDGASGSMQECGKLDAQFVDEKYRYLYHLTTFSLSFDDNGDLTADEASVVQCYEVPKKVSDAIYLVNPVAFWL